ncbi:MAG: tRNA isopentenyl-2-thiomethyl-A-37 hydroxylase MiaE, partial [Pseudomonadota bacterium]
IMRELDVPFERLSASRYAGRLRDAVRDREPERLLDVLLVGAIIEARSCERFAAVAGRLPDELGRFYRGLLSSEARHFEHYLHFAKVETGSDDATVAERTAELLEIEASLITAPDAEFRFHSGAPASVAEPSPRSVAG